MPLSDACLIGLKLFGGESYIQAFPQASVSKDCSVRILGTVGLPEGAFQMKAHKQLCVSMLFASLRSLVSRPVWPWTTRHW